MQKQARAGGYVPEGLKGYTECRYFLFLYVGSFISVHSFFRIFCVLISTSIKLTFSPYRKHTRYHHSSH